MKFLIIVIGVIVTAIIMSIFMKFSSPSKGTSNAVFGATQDMLDKEKQNAMKEIHMHREQKTKEAGTEEN
ncbi:MAG: hypothetical protein PVH88_24660 [Ignavibacteria bacterium]|jgi:hypothetical protein